MTPSDKPTDAELLEIAKAAAADFVSSSIAEAPESECPPGLLTTRYNIWGEYRQVDGSTDESRIASGLGDVDAAFFAIFNPALAVSLLERLQAAEAERGEALTICRDMVQAEDDLIAGLQSEGRYEDVLKLDFPIMHRMRALVARASDGDANV